MLVWLFLRHMVETLEAEELLAHMKLPAAAAAAAAGGSAVQPLCTQLVRTLLELLASCRLDDHPLLMVTDCVTYAMTAPDRVGRAEVLAAALSV